MSNNLILLGLGGVALYVFMRSQAPKNFVVNANSVSEAKSELFSKPANGDVIKVPNKPLSSRESEQIYQPPLSLNCNDCDKKKPMFEMKNSAVYY